MLKDVPQADDFKRNGLAFLNLAWDSITNLSQTHHSVKDLMDSAFTEEDRFKTDQIYWQKSQPALATAVALAHQGGEFLIKSKIAAVSPFLLLSVDKWPENIQGVDKSFADFKTVDAKELIKLHDTVCSAPLPALFSTNFEELRRLRNTIMHSIHQDQPFTPRKGALAVLDTAETLIGPQSWQSIRFAYREEKTDIWFFESDFNAQYNYAVETLHVIRELLTPAESLKYYGFNKKQHSYFCVKCFEEYEDLVFTAQLTCATPTATEARCVSCQTTFPVRRRQCNKCVGNVFGRDRWDYRWTCLKCDQDSFQDEEQ